MVSDSSLGYHWSFRGEFHLVFFEIVHTSESNNLK